MRKSLQPLLDVTTSNVHLIDDLLLSVTLVPRNACKYIILIDSLLAADTCDAQQR